MAENALTLPAVTSPKPPQSVQKSQSFGFTPSTFDEAVKLSKIIAESGLAPKDFQGKPQAVFVALQMGAEVGLAPMQAIQNIAVINGRPSLWGDAALAVVQAHASYEWHKEKFEGTGDNRVAVFTIKRKGAELHETRFGVADAKKANLWGKQGPWSQYPDRMMQMRARSFGLRDQFADALRGISIAEELQDFPGVTINSAEVMEDVERKFRDRATELLEKYCPEMNTAQRQAQIAKFHGRMQELVAGLEQKYETAEMPHAATDGADGSDGDTSDRASLGSTPEAASPVTPRNSDANRVETEPRQSATEASGGSRNGGKKQVDFTF